MILSVSHCIAVGLNVISQLMLLTLITNQNVYDTIAIQ